MKIRKLILTLTVFATTPALSQNAVRLEGSGFDMQGPTAELYGFVMADTGYKSGQYALANLIYYPVKELMTAVELQYGRRQNWLAIKTEHKPPEELVLSRII